ncbi:winged helix-turn-helix transcriptional regulator [Haloarcula salina]|uniref:winged helix-turn-helix transcriptional regulator n=1 Tax=Haloarcula salina TaxID=1429914 RepID=UPI003C6FEC77
MRHKQILDVAADNPEASIEDLAAEVPSATPDLVERVLEKHGDPASKDDGVDGESTGHTPSADGTASPTATDDDAAAVDTATPTDDDAPVTAANQPDGQSYPAPDEISPTQRETLRAIIEHPTASQRDLADVLDVTASTVSNRVNSIDGFDWSERETFAHAVLGDAESPTTEQQSPPEVVDTVETVQSTVDELSTQIEDLEGRMETVTDGSGAAQAPAQSRVFDDPELVHKVVHACMDSENITEDEELRILKSLL